MIYKKDIFDLDTRRRIYNFILNHPGLHFRNISRELNMPRSTLEYHLRYLKARGFLNPVSQGNYTYYYVLDNKLDSNQKKMLHLLSKEVPRNIIIFLIYHFCTSQIELSKCLEKHPTTIEFHLKKLLNAGIIEPAPTKNGKVYIGRKCLKIILRKSGKNEIIYRLKDTPLMYNLLIYYNKNLNCNFINDLSYICKFHASINNKPSVLGRNGLLDSIEKEILNVFPHPYHS